MNNGFEGYHYGQPIYYILKNDFHPRMAYFSYDYQDSLYVTTHDDDSTDIEIPFEKIDSIISKEEYEEMLQPAKSYRPGDNFNGPNDITFRVVAIYNHKYIILIKRKDGTRVWSYTTEYRINKLATKVA